MKDEDVSLQDLIKARDKCAYIIAKYGQQYLPLFERLEKEIEIREERQKYLDKALKIATPNVTLNATPMNKKGNALQNKIN